MDSAGRRQSGDVPAGVGRRPFAWVDGQGRTHLLSRVHWSGRAKQDTGKWGVSGHGDPPPVGRHYYVTGMKNSTVVVSIVEVLWFGVDREGWATWRARVDKVGALKRPPHWSGTKDEVADVPDLDIEVPY